MIKSSIAALCALVAASACTAFNDTGSVGPATTMRYDPGCPTHVMAWPSTFSVADSAGLRPQNDAVRRGERCLQSPSANTPHASKCVGALWCRGPVARAITCGAPPSGARASTVRLFQTAVLVQHDAVFVRLDRAEARLDEEGSTSRSSSSQYSGKSRKSLCSIVLATSSCLFQMLRSIRSKVDRAPA